ncbi:MAG: hypothetical protein WKG07_13400, partial [Hymenobacter sp.]
VQQAAKADTTKAPTTDAPVVAPAAGSAGGLPLHGARETYTVKAKGTRHAATAHGYWLCTGTVERIYFTTSHTANIKLTTHWLLPASASFSYGKQDGPVLRASRWASSRPPTSAAG